MSFTADQSGQSTVRLTWPQADLVHDLAELRRVGPLTHCHSNSVGAALMANALLAVGASPAMIAAREEVVEFAALADGVLINLASVTEERAEILLLSAAAAERAGTPWVLDPVAVGVLAFRTRLAHELLRFKPAVIKGNASEILALAGLDGRAKGVDATRPSREALPAARELALQTGAVVAVTGAIDFITDGRQTIEIAGGHPLMARVTGTGCALGALIAAFLGVSPTPLRAACAAATVFAVAGEEAGRGTTGPGSFIVGFLDLLSQLGERQTELG